MKSLRILHVANFGFKATKVYLHCTAAKLSNGWIRAGHHVINFSDRDIARWASPFGFRSIGKNEANKQLIRLCRSIQPDVIAFGHADIISTETLDTLRQQSPSTRMLQWNVDWWVNSNEALREDSTAHSNRQKILKKRPFLDATFITTAGEALSEIKTAEHIAAFLPNPVDRSLERGRNFELSDLPDDIFFASNAEEDRRFHCGNWRNMGALCEEIQTKIPELKCGFYGINGRAKVFGPAYEEAICRSRIGLNISRRNDRYLYSSDRLSHLIGNGLAVCLDRATGYADLFGEDEMIFYSSENELIEKLAAHKKDDIKRREIAYKGWKKYTELFNSTLVSQYMLDVIFGTHNPDRYVWPTIRA